MSHEGINRLLGFYRQQITIDVSVQLQYRVAMLLWVLGTLISPIIYLSVWQAASGAGEIAGYSAAGFAAYYIVLMIVDHFTNTWSLWTMEDLVQGGELSGFLLRAINPVHTEAARHVGFKILMIIAVVPSVLLLAVIFHPDLNPPLWVIPLFVPVVLLASVLSFMSGWVVSLSAFWLTRVNAIARLYLLAMMFFAGRLAPLDVMPEPLQAIAAVLPFRWMVAFPVELLLGRVTPQQAVIGISAQLFWLTVAFLLADRVWRIGIRRYSAVGG